MIDRLDAKILKIVQQNNRITVDQLGAEVGLSASACQRRLSRLRADQVIRGDVVVVDPAKVGKKLTMIIDVTLEQESTESINRFKETMRAHPQVMQCYYITGDKDFVLILCMRDMEEFQCFQQEFCIDNPVVSRFSTSVVVDPVKVGLAVEISEDGF
jgi:Lrp/AsnC family leucine-responsive transcriptional regulator